MKLTFLVFGYSNQKFLLILFTILFLFTVFVLANKKQLKFCYTVLNFLNKNI